jgi:DNA-binding MarR family transcriptional regulator
VRPATVVARTAAIGYTRVVRHDAGRRSTPDARARGRRRAAANDPSDIAFDLIGDRFITATQNLRRSHRRIDMQRELYWVGDRELTPAQVDALEVLCRRDQWRMREIAVELGVDRSTATRTIAPLVDLGLATRRTDEHDRRNVLLAPTRTGRVAAERIAEGRRHLMREVLSRIEPERRVLLTDLMEEYVAALEGSNGASATRA